eukprot:391106-Pelagomonas_calceolata.AAC.4
MQQLVAQAKKCHAAFILQRMARSQGKTPPNVRHEVHCMRVNPTRLNLTQWHIMRSTKKHHARPHHSTNHASCALRWGPQCGHLSSCMSLQQQYRDVAFIHMGMLWRNECHRDNGHGSLSLDGRTH